jgi:hypothetical protein
VLALSAVRRVAPQIRLGLLIAVFTSAILLAGPSSEPIAQAHPAPKINLLRAEGISLEVTFPACATRAHQMSKMAKNETYSCFTAYVECQYAFPNPEHRALCTLDFAISSDKTGKIMKFQEAQLQLLGNGVKLQYRPHQPKWHTVKA